MPIQSRVRSQQGSILGSGLVQPRQKVRPNFGLVRPEIFHLSGFPFNERDQAPMPRVACIGHAFVGRKGYGKGQGARQFGKPSLLTAQQQVADFTHGQAYLLVHSQTENGVVPAAL